MPLLGLFILAPPTFAAHLTCNLPHGYDKYFLQALNELEDTTISKITGGLDDIGIGPLGNSLPVDTILDFKSDVFQKLFGDEPKRADLFNITAEFGVDIGEVLEENLGDLTGTATEFAELNIITCDFNETLELFSLELLLTSPAIEWNLPDLSSVDVSFLPASFPALDMNDADPPSLEVGYYLSIPLSISLKLKRFFLGEVKANLSIGFEAELSKSLPVLPTENITFEGRFGLAASFDYSSISDFSLSGEWGASLKATSDGTGVGQISVRAFDENFFDSSPRK